MAPQRQVSKGREPKVVIHPSWKQAAAVITSIFVVGSGWVAFHKAVVMPSFVEEVREKFASRESIEELNLQVKDMRSAMERRLERIEDRLLQLERNK